MAVAQWTDAVEWLAAAAQDPQACRSDWRDGGSSVHLLAAGRLWDVLIVPTCLGLRAADILDGLPRPGAGPVLLDGRRQQAGFFLPADPAATWVGSGTRYLGRGGWIAAPAPHCRWGDLRWLLPPDGSGTLNTPAATELALQRAARELARAHGSAHHTHEPPALRHLCRSPRPMSVAASGRRAALLPSSAGLADGAVMRKRSRGTARWTEISAGPVN